LNLVSEIRQIKETYKSKVDGSRLRAWALLVEVGWVFGDTSETLAK
jgi:hypothetical protein